jgi:hypothetical protein
MEYRLSTHLTIIHKFLPLIVFFYLAGWAFYGLFDFLVYGSLGIGRLLLSFVFIAFFGAITFWLCVPLKAVVIEGDQLLISNFFKQIRIPTSEIVGVEGPDNTSLTRIKIKLQNKTIFGDVIIFTPGFLRAWRVADFLRTYLKKN